MKLDKSIGLSRSGWQVEADTNTEVRQRSAYTGKSSCSRIATVTDSGAECAQFLLTVAIYY